MPLRFSPNPGAGTISLQAASLSATQAAVSAAAAVISATAAAASATAAAASAAIGRTRLVADRTYYVRTNGSDSNTGLANTAIGAFLTVQKAWDVIFQTLDLGGKYIVTVQIADGSYAGLAAYGQPPGTAGPTYIVFQGNAASRSAVTLTAGSGSNSVTYGSGSDDWGGISIKNMKLASASGDAISVTGPLIFDNIEFGTCTGNHISALHGAFVSTSTPYFVSGNAVFHAIAQTGSTIALHAGTITYSNTPAFTWNIVAQSGGRIFIGSNTFTNGNTVTGTRFVCQNSGSYIDIGASSSGLTYIPGNAAGVIQYGGQYDTMAQGVIAGAGPNGVILDADITANRYDYLIYHLGGITAARTINLPAGSTLISGFRLLVVDAQGTCTAVNKITATAFAGDFIGVAGGVFAATADLITTAFGSAELIFAGEWVKR